MTKLIIQIQKRNTIKTEYFNVNNQNDVDYWLWAMKVLGGWKINNYVIK